jgi:hypothetical protein
MARIDGKNPGTLPLADRSTPPVDRGIPARPRGPQVPAAPAAEPVDGRLPGTLGRPGVRPQKNQVPAELRQAPGKLGQAEAERLFSQAGFARMGKRRGKGVELDNVTDGPIPLPLDEVDASAWEQASLDDAQEQMAVASQQLGELSLRPEGEPPGPAGDLAMAHALVAGSAAPTEAEVARLEALEAAPEGPEVGLQDARAHAQALFGLNLSDVAQGPALLACSLLVGGLSEAVQPEGGGLRTAAVAGGLQRLIERSQHAVGDARQMSTGINKERAIHRTLISKKT